MTPRLGRLRHASFNFMPLEAALREKALAAAEVEELRRLNWALSAYAGSISALIHGANARHVMLKTCEAIVSQGAYILAAVGLAEHSEGKPVEVMAMAGPAAGYFRDLKLSWSEDDPGGKGPAGAAITSGKARVSNDILADPDFAPWREHARDFGIRACVIVPFSRAKVVLGILMIYSAEPKAFGGDELALFKRLGEELAFAITLDRGRARLAAAETGLGVSEARFEKLVKFASSGILVTDREGRFIEANPALCRLLGYEREEMIGMEAEDLIAEEEHEFIAAAFADVQSLGAHEGKWRLRRKSGAEIIAEITVTNMPDGEVVAIVRDVTAQTRAESAQSAAEEALRETQSRLSRAGRAAALGEVVATISHEINQPLAALLANSHAAERWMDRTPPNLEETRKSIGWISRDARRASDIIKRVRALLAGRPPEMTTFDLNAALVEVLALSHSEQGRAGVMTRLRLAQDLPPVLADRVQIQQVALNLIINGIDAMARVEDRQRRLTVATRITDTGAVMASVADEGEGFGAIDPDQLFDQFFTTKAEGMGVGLSVSRSIIQAHGGRIWAEPGNKVGAVFRFTLPTGPEATMDDSPFPSPSTGSAP
jgi:PAS domain S-box-containing protein